jgi:hypothetical protein
MDALARGQQAANTTRRAAVQSLASAVVANPAPASMVVPEAYWEAIYGPPASAATGANDAK